MTQRFKQSGIMRSFHYDCGSLSEGQRSFTLTEEGDYVHLIYQKTSFGDGSEVRGDYAIPLTVMGQLKNVLMTNKIYLWNGFDKSNSVMAGADSFSLNAVFDRYRLHAYGMGMTPFGYKETGAILLNYLEGVVKANLGNEIE